MTLTPDQDAPGQAMLDFLDGRGGSELVERDDGNIEPSGGPDAYFTGPADWAPYELEALKHVRGSVLDIGCGAGRISLHLQKLGHRVTGIDSSPGAVETSKRRGVADSRLMSVTGFPPRLGTFGTIIMYGNNFGLFANERRARWLLRRFHRITDDAARIVAESVDPYQTDDERHLGYHERNRRRGRMGGQVRIRVRYKRLATPWFDYLLASEAEVNRLLKGTGWHLQHAFHSEAGPYSMVIVKE